MIREAMKGIYDLFKFKQDEKSISRIHIYFSNRRIEFFSEFLIRTIKENVLEKLDNLFLTSN